MYLKWLQQFNLLVFEEIDSTNNEAKRLIQSGALDRLVIWSKQQSYGRGRYGRSWNSQEGNLYMSILLPIQCSLAKAAQLSFVMGLCVHDVINDLAKKNKIKLDINLKWPNDVLIQGSKIAGILLESLPEEDSGWIVLGLGVNVEHTPDVENATSLKELGIKSNVGHLLGMVMNKFDYYHNMWSLYGFSKIRQLWLKKAYKIGEVVTITDIKNRISGVFETIDKDGAMKIKIASGEKYTMSTGEIFFG
jgi:BirA family biotin operon repressor/biotin-[acetyl-CoA-carboxylase] ligase